MYVYLFTNNNHHYKIGVSKNPEKRIKQLQTGNSEQVEMIFKYLSEKYAHKIERTLHSRFQTYRLNGEWFELPTKESLKFMLACKKIENNFKYLDENKI